MLLVSLQEYNNFLMKNDKNKVCIASLERLTVDTVKNLMNAGARGGTRTPTPVKEPDPKSGASTNFATRARTCMSI